MNNAARLLCFSFLMLGVVKPGLASNLKSVIRQAQNKVVKIYGAGGFQQMEAYQTGILVSPQGHVLTAWSYVLDTDDLLVTLNDGRKWQAELVGSDPLLEIAVLKLPLEDEELPHFDLQQQTQAFAAQRVMALSNLFGIATGDESVSVMQGVITALTPLDARRGSFQSNYRGEVYVLDASANNPGAAGGALIDFDGQLLGVLGKELRSRVTGTWLNYALPTSSIRSSAQDIISGRNTRPSFSEDTPVSPLKPLDLGIVLIPNILARTPAYVDIVKRNSPAERVGLRTDDLIVYVNATPVTSHTAFVNELKRYEREEEIEISVIRNGTLLEFRLLADEPDGPPTVPIRESEPDSELP